MLNRHHVLTDLEAERLDDMTYGTQIPGPKPGLDRQPGKWTVTTEQHGGHDWWSLWLHGEFYCRYASKEWAAQARDLHDQWEAEHGRS